jgi:hypothetical protein
VPTLPPAIPVEEIPVVALEPVESAPPPVATTEPARSQPTREAVSRPDEDDDDPFNIFEPDDVPRIVQSQNDNLERARELQDGGNRGGQDDRGGSQEDFPEIVVPTPDIDIPEIVAADDVPVIQRRDGSVEVIMPDVDAMIDEITARATDPNRNPNVGDAGRSRANRDDSGDEPTPTPRRNRKKARDKESGSPITNVADSPSFPVIEPSNPGRGGDDCPFANLPEDQRPKDWPFGDC